MRPIRKLLAIAVLVIATPVLADPAVDKLLEAHSAYAKRLEKISYRFHDKFRTGAPPQRPLTDVERKGSVDRDGRKMRAKVEHTQPPHPAETQDLVENDEYLFHRQGNNGISKKLTHKDGTLLPEAAGTVGAFLPQILQMPISPFGGQPFVEFQLGRNAEMAKHYTVKEDDTGITVTLDAQGKQLVNVRFGKEHGLLLESYRGMEPRSGKLSQQVDIEYAKVEGSDDFWYPKRVVQKVWNDPAAKEATLDYAGEVEELKPVASFPPGHFTMEALDIFTMGEREMLMDIRPTGEPKLLHRKNGQWVGEDGSPGAATASGSAAAAKPSWMSRRALVVGMGLLVIGGLRLLARRKALRG